MVCLHMSKLGTPRKDFGVSFGFLPNQPEKGTLRKTQMRVLTADFLLVGLDKGNHNRFYQSPSSDAEIIKGEHLWGPLHMCQKGEPKCHSG